VSSGRDAAELLLAGADAVQVGTATFRDPKAPWKVLRQLDRWCDGRGTSVAEVRAAARRRPLAASLPEKDGDEVGDHDGRREGGRHGRQLR
jgi:hypothetical protein